MECAYINLFCTVVIQRKPLCFKDLTEFVVQYINFFFFIITYAYAFAFQQKQLIFQLSFSFVPTPPPAIFEIHLQRNSIATASRGWPLIKCIKAQYTVYSLWTIYVRI